MAFDYAKAYQQFIDEELVAASATAWMIPEAGKVRFTGGRDVEISTLSTSGLGNYDATKSDGSAYPSGTVSNDWTTYTLAMDRGVKFALDRTSPNDTNFLATAENVIREFARNALVKEQDAYRIQKLYALANADTAHKGTHIVSAALTKSNIIEKVCGLLQTVRDDAEVMDGYVALVSHKNKSAFLAAATGTYHSITFGAGNSGGIVSATGAQDINVLLAHCSAPLAVSKLDSIKQFGPEENQFFDGTAIQARYLYDLFMPTKSVVSLGAIVEPAQAAGGN